MKTTHITFATICLFLCLTSRSEADPPASAAASLSSWSTLTTGGASDHFFGIESDFGVLIAFGQTTWVSHDKGTTWFAAIQPNGTFIKKGFNHNGTWYGVGQQFLNGIWQAAILSSSNSGYTWNVVNIPSGISRLNDIDASPWGPLVAVGDNGAILSSSNGLTWTIRNSGTSQHLRAVTHISLQEFVAVGDGTTILRSTDGTNWSFPSFPPQVYNGYDDVIYENFRVITAGNSRGFDYSAIGSGFWNTQPFLQNRWFRGLTYANGVYLSVGWDTSSGAPLDSYYVSEDGINWCDLGVNTGYNNLQDVAYHAGSFYAVGENGSILKSNSLTPRTLATWKTEYFPGGGTDAADNADPDGDGLANLLEYAFGNDPTNPSSASLPTMNAGGTSLTFAVQKNVDATDLYFEVQRSTSISGWSTNNLEVVSETANELTVRSTVAASADREFLRLMVSKP